MTASPSLPVFRFGSLEAACQQAATEWEAADATRRLFERDPTLFTSAGEEHWLAWLDAPENARPRLAAWQRHAQSLADDSYCDVVILGMGGSSLCPDVLAKTFAPSRGAPRLRVLDSTVPDSIRRLQSQIDLETTLFLVASKSGSTLEPEVLRRYFFDLARTALGPEAVGRHFAAITDPGSDLEATAQRDGYRFIAYGEPSIGGRFSALSAFGLLPAALMGLDIPAWIESACAMATACRDEPGAQTNPGVGLGIALGVAAKAGREKLTLVLPPEIAALGGWIEQLVAESTGKAGRGILPVEGESLEAPEAYAGDRLFLHYRIASSHTPETQRRLEALVADGHPLVEIEIESTADLPAEFYRLEIATAVAGSLLGVNPFDQPDVEDAKVAARERMTRFESGGTLASGEPTLGTAAFDLILPGPEVEPSPLGAAEILSRFFGNLGPGDYLGINAFVDPSTGTCDLLAELREAIRRARSVATTLGFGPRFLHSTGQLHKGGPASGAFLVIASDETRALPIPGLPYDFGVLKQAQAEGDFEVLCRRGRRALRVQLHPPMGESLERFVQLATSCLAAPQNGDPA